ncbi:MAG: isoprenylcysteine carboxylmethyltransferase family protein [Nitrosomonadales bacterium]|nr:isoprenylcysteine carboxylmethyltransferase family protein [Nitrosomonadales bacterium]
MYWSIKTLGNQWAIHATGLSRLTNEQVLIVAGPYKYVRHPIYMSYVLDLLGLTLALSTFYSLILVVLVNLPSYVLRAKYEEISSAKRFGDSYAGYKEKSSFIFPRIKDK